MGEPGELREEPAPPPPLDATPDAPTLRIPVRVELRAAPEGAAPERARARAPRRTAGRYLIEEEIGRGGMGVVYRAFDRDLRRPVAMKVLPFKLDVDRDLSARFVEEAQATAQLQHPGIVPVYEIGLTDDGMLFFTMKLVHGRTLAEVVSAVRAGDSEAVREFSLYRLLQVFVEIARTVSYAHERGVVHRDLKPQNVMIGRHGEVQVMDWGLAKVLAGREVAAGEGAGARAPKGRAETRSDTVIGTPAYMPPEQAAGDPARLGPRSDVYALGAVLHHILTGRAPFDGRTSDEVLERVCAAEPPPHARDVDRSVPRDLDAITWKALAKEPLARYESARALADDAQAWLEGRPVAARKAGIARRAALLAGRHRGLAAALAGALVLGAVGAVVALGRIEGERRRAEARAAEARASEARTLFERGDRALEARRPLEAAVLLARSLALEDRRETRCRLLEARAHGGLPRTGGPRDAGGWATSFAISADGRTLAAAGALGHVRVLDLDDGREVAAVEAGRAAPFTALAPDGRRLAVSTDDSRQRVVDLETRAERALPDAPADGPLAYSADGARLATDSGGRVFVFDCAKNATTAAFVDQDTSPCALAFTPDGARLVIGGDRVTLVDAESGATIVRHADRVGAIAVDPCGKRFAAATDQRTIVLYSAPTGEVELTIERIPAATRSLAFSPDGRALAAGGDDGFVRLYDVERGSEELRLPGHATTVTFVAFARADRLVSADAEGKIVESDLAGRKEGRIVRFDANGELEWTADGRALCADSARAGAVALRDPETGAETFTAEGSAIAASPDGRRIAVGSVGGSVSIIDAASRTEERRLFVAKDEIVKLAFSDDGAALVAIDLRAAGRAWHTASGEAIAIPLVRGCAPVVIAPSGDGRRLLLGIDRPEVTEVVDLFGGSRAEVPARPGSLSVHQALDRAGRRLAWAGPALAVRVWDVEARREVATLGGEERTSRFEFAPDGRRLAVGTYDRTVRVYDVDSEREALVFRDHGDIVTAVAWSRDGRRLAVESADGVLRVWDVEAVERFLARPAGEVIDETVRETALPLDAPSEARTRSSAESISAR
jgi:WD40 repeat protein